MAASQGSENSPELPSLEKGKPKRLTVTFKDLGIQVRGAGEDFVSTIASSAANLFTFTTGLQAQRVQNYQSSQELHR